jgi:hypothetical protein
MIAKNTKFWFYLFVSLAAFFPCLFLGRSFFDGDLINQYGFYRFLLQKGLFHGQIPFWDPYLQAGQPFFADPNAMESYPLLYPTLLFPLAYGFGVFFFIHLFLGLWGADHWLGALGLSENARRVGALTFALSGFFWWEIIHPPILAAFVWLPWFLGGLEKLARSPKPTYALGTGLAYAMLFLSGNPQMSISALYGGGLYFLIRCLSEGSPWRKKIWKGEDFPKSLFLLFILLFGTLPLWILGIPALEFLRLSDRALEGRNFALQFAGLTLDPTRFWQALFPAPLEKAGQLQLLSVENGLNNSLFIGLWAPFFLAWSLKGKRRELSIFTILFGLLFICAGLGNHLPFYPFICQWVPGFSILRGPFRLVFLTTAFFTLAAGIGYENYLESLKRNRVMAIASGLGFALLLFWIGGESGLTWPSGIFLLLSAVVFVWGSHRKNTWVGTVFPVLLAFSFIANGWVSGSSRLGPSSNFDFAKNRPELAPLAAWSDHSRVFIGDNIPYPVQASSGPQVLELPSEVSIAMRIRNVGGYNPFNLAKMGNLHTIPFDHFTRLWAVKGFVTGNEKGKVTGFERQDWGPLRVYTSQEDHPYLFSPESSLNYSGEDRVLEAMRQKNFDPAKQVLFSDSGPIKAAVPGAGLKYSWEKEGTDEESFRVELGRDNWVVFSEVNYPGWKAWVDGVSVPVVTADYLLRAVYVPKGKHLVQFSFQPDWLLPIQLGGVLWLAGLLWFSRHRKKWDKSFAL